MKPGTILGARLTLLEQVDHDIPGIQRYLAQDSRLGRRTLVDIVDGELAGDVRTEAARASRLRDPRLARIVSAGQEDAPDGPVTYVAVEHVPGARLSDVLARHRVEPRRALAIAAGAARALTVARATGMSHGFVRPACVTVSPRGRVVIAGLGVDGHVAAHAGLVPAPSEKADARAVAAILVRALTGIDVGEATADDLPDGIPASARGLVLETLQGTGPDTLAELVSALSGADSRALVDFASTVDTLPLTPRLEREAAERAQREAEEAARREEEARAAARALVAAETLVVAQRSADEAIAEARSEPGLHEGLRTVVATVVGPAEPEQEVEEEPLPLDEPEPVTESIPEVARPADRHEAAFDTLEIMVAEQNRTREPGTWESVLAALHRRWPGNPLVARSLRRARERAIHGGPLNGARVVIAIALFSLVLAVLLAFGWLDSPLDPAIVIEQDPSSIPNPAVTATLTPSPDPSA
ncbi:hypothetical protein [Demequina mangrovi]|uniref:Protein kinase domain-containing protein n=1 Tax=Demequina mangrovi TaxID=1043493 RepID=A0A1H6ZWQ9_9MICO|nr:hypothetical protein [Demequina mangrovi]SEJ57913.1 hypothetical protein SAMN05421637_2277 [Demequina mangrovi]